MTDKQKRGRIEQPTLADRVLKRYRQLKVGYGHPTTQPRDSLQMRLAREFEIPCQQVLDIVDPDRRKLEARNEDHRYRLAQAAKWEQYQREQQAEYAPRKLAEAAEMERRREMSEDERRMREVDDTLIAAHTEFGGHTDVMTIGWVKPYTVVVVYSGDGGTVAYRHRLNPTTGKWEGGRINHNEVRKQKEADRKGRRRKAHEAGVAKVEAVGPHTEEGARMIYAMGWREVSTEFSEDEINKRFREWWPNVRPAHLKSNLELWREVQRRG